MSKALKLPYAGQPAPTTHLFNFEQVTYFRNLQQQTMIHLLNFEQAVVDKSAGEIWQSVKADLPFFPFTAFDTTVYVNLDQIERYFARRSNTEFQFKDGSHLWVEEDFLTFTRLLHQWEEKKN